MQDTTTRCACGSEYTLRLRRRRDGTEYLGRVCRPCATRWTMTWRDAHREKYLASRRATHQRSKAKSA